MLGSEGFLLVLRLPVRLLLVRRLLGPLVRLLEDPLERLLVRLLELFFVIIPYSGNHPGGIFVKCAPPIAPRVLRISHKAR